MSGDDGYQVGRPDRRAVAAAGRARLLAVLSVAFVVACGGSDNAAGPAGPPSQSPPLSYLALFPARLVAVVGEQITLTVTARDVDGATLGSVAPQYISTNPDVVRIEPGPAGTSGQLLASGVGTATVRASAGGQTAEAIIHVGSASYALALGPPRVLNGNYIDLSKIERVSRFRSTVGHSYTNDTGVETCRSMKHYFEPRLSVDWTTVDVYAPAPGIIRGIRVDGRGYQVSLRPRDLPALNVTIFHVSPDPGLVIGTWVEAGDRIGRHASSFTMSDIAMSIGPKQGGTLISYFEAMTDSVFAEYQTRGVPSRQAAIITREERDADPVSPLLTAEQHALCPAVPGQQAGDVAVRRALELDLRERERAARQVGPVGQLDRFAAHPVDDQAVVLETDVQPELELPRVIAPRQVRQLVLRQVLAFIPHQRRGLAALRERAAVHGLALEMEDDRHAELCDFGRRVRRDGQRRAILALRVRDEIAILHAELDEGRADRVRRAGLRGAAEPR
jgi:hypothetical protein